MFDQSKYNKTPKKIYGVKLKQGQFITGRASACEELNIKPSTVYNRLLRLQEYGYIKLESTNKYTIVSVSNYSKYQVGQSVPKIPIDERLEQLNKRYGQNGRIDKLIMKILWLQILQHIGQSQTKAKPKCDLKCKKHLVFH